MSSKKIIKQLSISSAVLLLAVSLTGIAKADEQANEATTAPTTANPAPAENTDSAPSEQNIALENAKLLLPYAEESEQVAYASKIAETDKLATTKLTAAVTMQDQDIVTDVYGKEGAINKLLLHFEDNSVDYKDLHYQETDKDKHASYQLDKELKYTPKQNLDSYTKILDKLETSLKEVDYKSEAMYQALGLTKNQEEAMDKLYLEKSFVHVQKNVRDFIRKVLVNDETIHLNQPESAKKAMESILDNKEKVLLSLAYLNRWYDVAYGDIKSKELTMFRQDFLGMKQEPLALLLNLGSKGFKGYAPQSNSYYYKQLLAPFTGQETLPDLLEYYREAFLPNTSNNDWFKANSKAYIVEKESKEVPNYSVNLYERLKDTKRRDVYSTKQQRKRFNNAILPLLTLPEHNVYIINNLSTLIFGTYDRYIDQELKTSNPVAYKLEAEKLEEKVNRAAEQFSRHFDMWYRVLPEQYKAQMTYYVPVWEGAGHYHKNPETNRWEGQWLPAYGDTFDSVTNFSGPAGAYIKDPGWYVGAYAHVGEGAPQEVVFVITNLLTERGLGTLTHEMVHMFDYYTYLLQKDRRQWMQLEAFPEGFLQAPDNSDVPIIGINSLLDHSHNQDRLRFHNLNPERFQNANDLQEYMHGIFDVVYTMEYAEGMAVLAKDKDIQRQWFNKLETISIPNADGYDEGRNIKRPFTDEEWQNLTLKTIDDLVDNNVMSNRGYNPKYDKTIEFDPDHPYHLLQNGYDMITPFGPIYASAESPSSPGDLSFKRTGFELLAAKGYEHGLVPYASNQYREEAYKEQDWSVSDSFVFKHLLPEYQGSFAEFKKAMYHERIEQLSQLRPVTIHYQNKEVTISSFDQLMALMKEAVDQDIAKNVIDNSQESQVTKLEMALLDAYLKLTDDFRTSIFAAKESQEETPDPSPEEKPQDKPQDKPQEKPEHTEENQDKPDSKKKPDPAHLQKLDSQANSKENRHVSLPLTFNSDSQVASYGLISYLPAQQEAPQAAQLPATGEEASIFSQVAKFALMSLAGLIFYKKKDHS